MASAILGKVWNILQFRFTNKHEIWNHHESTQNWNLNIRKSLEWLNSHFESLQPWKLLSTTSSGKYFFVSEPFQFPPDQSQLRRGRKNFINHKARSEVSNDLTTPYQRRWIDWNDPNMSKYQHKIAQCPLMTNFHVHEQMKIFCLELFLWM